MKPEEKQAIENLLDDICENTTAVYEIATYLRSKKFLTEDEQVTINKTVGPSAQCNLLYSYVMKKDAWEDLLKVLRQKCNGDIADSLDKEKKRILAEVAKSTKKEQTQTQVVAPGQNEIEIRVRLPDTPDHPIEVQQLKETTAAESPSSSITPPPRGPQAAALEDDGACSSRMNKVDKYHLEGKGSILIINNEFTPGTEMHRQGSKIDVDSLKELFRGRMKNTIDIKRDVEADELPETLETFKNTIKQGNFSFLAVIIGTHGLPGNQLVMNDGREVNLFEDIVYKFDSSFEEFKGKPKLFFVQACDAGVIKKDGAETLFDTKSKGMKMEDTFVGLACLPRHSALRHIFKGTPYFQTICQVFGEHWQKKDLVTMHKDVQKEVAKSQPQQPFFIEWEFRGLFKFPRQ